MRNIAISRGRARKLGAEGDLGVAVAVLEITAAGVAEVDVTGTDVAWLDIAGIDSAGLGNPGFDVAWIAVEETDSIGVGVACIGIRVTLLSNEPFDRSNVSPWD